MGISVGATLKNQRRSPYSGNVSKPVEQAV